MRAFLRLLAIVSTIASVSSALAADEWVVVKISGEAWSMPKDGTPAAISVGQSLPSGQFVQTSRNGRVQLTRGVTTVQVMPNSLIGLPVPEGERSVLVQQAGTVALSVEKKGVEHFEVKTPYLAAVVKGTQFTVQLNGRRAAVSVSEGRVDVTDFKSGQSVLVLPGQRASVTPMGASGLHVSGRGEFQQVRHGAPVASDVQRVTVPRGGFHQSTNVPGNDSKPKAGGHAAALGGVIHSAIGAPPNVHRLTNGLAASSGQNGTNGRGRKNGEATIWQPAPTSSGTATASTSDGNSSGNSANANANSNANANANAANGGWGNVNSNAGGNSGAASGNSNAGGNSGNSNAGGNSGNSNAGGNGNGRRG